MNWNMNVKKNNPKDLNWTKMDYTTNVVKEKLLYMKYLIPEMLVRVNNKFKINPIHMLSTEMLKI